MSDLISRQAAIDAVNKALDRETIMYSFVRKVAIDSIKTVPTAQPDERMLHESCTDCPLYDKDRHNCPRFNKVIPEVLREAQTEQRWIPCSERMPEEPFGCLVTVWDNEPMTGEMFENLLPYFVGWDGEQWNDWDGMQCPFEIIAWMPLPKPYKMDEEECEDGQIDQP